jgi:lactate dehydrogenase-like 2-hydroxyacid dehydrogenase
MLATSYAILINGAVADDIVAALRERYEVFDCLPHDLDTSDAERVRVIATMGTVRNDRELFRKIPNLGLVCCAGSGYEGTDLAAAEELGVAVTHGRGTNASAVADLAIGLLLACVRSIPAADRFVRQGSWERDRSIERYPRPGLTGRRLGIFGLGAIGLKIATRAGACEMEVGYFSRSRVGNVPYTYVPSLLGLAAWADDLMIAVRASPETKHAVNAAVLEAIGSDGYLVNIARGSVVDERALTEAVRTGQFAGAGLDVFEHEPAVPEGLLASDRVVLTPHLGGMTAEAHQQMRELLLANVEAFFSHRPLLTPVRALSSGTTQMDASKCY